MDGVLIQSRLGTDGDGTSPPRHNRSGFSAHRSNGQLNDASVQLFSILSSHCPDWGTLSVTLQTGRKGALSTVQWRTVGPLSLPVIVNSIEEICFVKHKDSYAIERRGS